ncbi:MAG: heme ABC transporter ATP-binding protein [Bacillota bacterium]
MAVKFSVLGATFCYETFHVLEDISLTIPTGDFVGIIGPNGSGKSTLIKGLAATLAPRVGSILMDGQEFNKRSRRELAHHLAVVPQETTASFDFTVEEVVLMGRSPYLSGWQVESPEDLQAAAEAMRLTGTWDLRHRPVTHLSGGERQRVFIARALAQNTPVILLDEPTAHLDINHQVEVLNLLRRLNHQGVTVIIVFHDLNLAAQYCSQVILLHQGRVYACGSVEEIFTTDTIRTVYQTEVLVGHHPVTGVPQVTLLGKKTPPAEEQPRVHVIGGGGAAAPLLSRLVYLGYRVSAGVLNKGDTDWHLARLLGITMAEEDPFSPISKEAYRHNLSLIIKAGQVILPPIPFGSGNLLNLQVLVEAMGMGIKVSAVISSDIDLRDYTGGQAASLYNQLIENGMETFPDIQQLTFSLVPCTERSNY